MEVLRRLLVLGRLSRGVAFKHDTGGFSTACTQPALLTLVTAAPGRAARCC